MSAKVANRLEFERDLWTRGIALVAGVDEAGRGPLAGPVVAAAVILPCAWRSRFITNRNARLKSQRD